MTQRFGRVNRFGERDDTRIDIVHPKPTDFEESEYDTRRCRTLGLLWWLLGDGSPASLETLDPETRVAAFAPAALQETTVDMNGSFQVLR